MVVLFVSPYFREKGKMPTGDGMEMYLYRVSLALKKLGHTPIIVSIGSKEQHYIENGIEIYFVYCKYIEISNNKNINLVYNRLLRSKAINKKVMQISKKKKIDLIQFSSLQGLSIFYYGNIPAVMRLSSYAKIYYKDYSFSKTEYWIRILCEWIGAKRCNALFGPSKVIANAFAKDVHRSVSIIETPFWNECHYYDESIYNSKLRNKKYTLFIGRMQIEKGIFVIKECLRAFLKSNPDYYFVCCGKDSFVDGQSAVCLLTDASGEYKNRFIYIEKQPHETLYPVIQHADFVICPSIAENFSNACLEAMYFERVVIGTDGTSYEQLIDDGKNGMLCEPGNADSLLQKMNNAAAMSLQEKEKMGKNANKRIERLKPEIAVEKLIRYYKYVIAHVCN